MCPNISFSDGLGMYVSELELSRHVSEPTATTGAGEQLVKPIEIHPVGSVYMPKLSGSPL